MTVVLGAAEADADAASSGPSTFIDAAAGPDPPNELEDVMNRLKTGRRCVSLSFFDFGRVQIPPLSPLP